MLGNGEWSGALSCFRCFEMILGLTYMWAAQVDDIMWPSVGSGFLPAFAFPNAK